MFYLGSSKRVFSDMNTGGTMVVSAPKNISSFNNDVGYISEEKTEEILSDYTKTEDVEKMVSQAVSQIPSGENGLSAYEIAVIYGFSGTEEEWLASLDGKDGEDGITPAIGENGNWFIGETDTGISSRGENGAAPTIKVGIVTTGVPGTQAEVTARTDDSETENTVFLDFVIPRGEKGNPGSSGGSGGGSGMAAFEIREDGHLWVVSETDAQAQNFYINDTGHLIYIVEG